MDPLELTTRYGWYLGTLAYSVLSGIVPFLNCEVFLLLLAVKAPRHMLVSLIVTTTAGQMFAKSLLYWTGRGVLRLPMPKEEGLLASISKQLGTGWRGALIIFASAVVGVPPFYAMSIACGALRWSFTSFLLFGFAGRLLRFSAVLLIPPDLCRRWMPGPIGIAVIVVACIFLVVHAARKARAKVGVAPIGG